jgi:hypothetical protein
VISATLAAADAIAHRTSPEKAGKLLVAIVL